ncbi:hypothetical protein KEJ51_04605 [Candidatus Bathyarchaeota archaeon]|nr:hypothetical protein [Candidatus Bathyarchaeota archaeon]MBS7629511.1 hypothetical protein [Candidatus Bathyarchaeota archaeon]MBS7631988.1 hypothetical protein [Candidatus Bathyarchaeota archaeon]
MDKIEALSEKDFLEKAIQLLDFAESILEKYLSENGFADKEELVKFLVEKAFSRDEAENCFHVSSRAKGWST